MVVLFLIFLGNLTLFSVIAVPVYISTNTVTGFPFLHILTNTYLSFFSKSHPDRCEVISIVVFIFVSLMMSDTEHLFICQLTILYVGEMSIQVLCPFFNWVGFFAIELYESLMILNINPLSDI